MVDIRRGSGKHLNRKLSGSEFTTEYPEVDGEGSRAPTPEQGQCLSFTKAARKASYMTSMSDLGHAKPHTPDQVEIMTPSPGVMQGQESIGQKEEAVGAGRPGSGTSKASIRSSTVHPGLDRHNTIASIHDVDRGGSINEGFDGGLMTVRSLGDRDAEESDGGRETDGHEIIPEENEDELHSTPWAREKSRHVQFDSDNTDKQEIILAYWRQIVQGSVTHKKAPSKEEIKLYLEEILTNAEVENKDKLKDEVYYIINHFRQRRCRHFCKRSDGFIEKARRALRRVGTFIGHSKDFCVCGLDKSNHTDTALKDVKTDWNALTSTEIVYPWCFGDLDIPGTYNYLETPGGSRKYIRMDDLKTDPRHLWELFTKYWGFKPPKLVISMTGGDVHLLQSKPKLYRKFRDGLMKIAVKTKAWLLTEGLHDGVGKEVGDIFQEDLKRSEYAEIEDHSNIPLIGFCPWGILADKSQLLGIHVGSKDATYSQHTVDRLNPSSGLPNALDPFHVAYVLTDNGTAGEYKAESELRRKFEKYIHRKINLSISGGSEVKTPLVLLVVGGDIFTYEKANDATANMIPIIVVHGSGGRADVIVSCFRSIEHAYPRAASGAVGWDDLEEQHFETFVSSYNTNPMTETPLSEWDQTCLKGIMKSRCMLEIFGVEAGDETNLDKAILKAIFAGVHDISAQLYLTLALDRPDIAKENIFIESRKHELKGRSHLLEQALLMGRAEFVDLLLDHDIGGELNDFDKFLTVERLHRLHAQNLDNNHVMGKLLRSFCKRNHYGDYVLAGAHLLPQVGRIIYMLMGSHYRLLYQEKEYRDVQATSIPHRMSSDRTEEAVWHLFLWAVLAGKRDIAELFLFETSAKIGAALIAFKMFRELSVAAEGLSEVELQEDMMKNAKYFENLAECTLDHLYEFNRDEAYTCLVSTLPFHWGKYNTPLSIGEDAGAMTFMGHASCQTLLNRVWMHYMDADTAKWKLFPLFAFLPFLNIPFIVFDKRNLAFGHYRQLLKDDQDFSPDVDISLSEEDKPSSKKQRSGSVKITSSKDRKSSVAQPETDGESSGEESDGIAEGEGKQKRRGNFIRRLKFALWCTRMYYTAPVNKFIFNLVSYLIFLGIFSHFILTELRPIDSITEITGHEWFIMAYVFSLTIEEIIQIIGRKCSGPLWNLSWQDLEPDWKETWSMSERFSFVLRLHKFSLWISDRWNSIDGIMLLLFYISVILRFSLPDREFDLVRTFFSVSLIIFYFRILRLGYILKDIGPRIVTIRHMMKDLIQFVAILAVFIISFGIAFQALLDPNKLPSWSLLVDILWRPYWQMYGEMYLDDTMGEMGRAVQVERNCTYDRTLSADTGLPICYSYMIPILLGVYMLITNILLLNLLIAIFSHSFETIETESQTVWRFHMYDLVHEYYNQPWLPPPLNVLCHLTNLAIYLLTWPQRWCYSYKKNKHINEIKKKSPHSTLFAVESQQGYNAGYIEHQAEEAMREDTCYCLWTKELVTRSTQDDTDHFLQHQFMRDEDLEEKAYKRYLRTQKKNWQEKVTKHLENSNHRLQQLASDVQDLKKERLNAGTAGPQMLRSKSEDRSDSFSGEERSPDIERHIRDLTVPLVRRMDQVDKKVDGLYDRLDNMSRDLGTITEYLMEKKRRRRRGSSSLSELGEEEEDSVRDITGKHMKRKR